MRIGPTLTLTARRHVLMAATLLAAVLAVAGPAWSATSVRVLLDRRPDGAAAPFFAALGRGLFRAEALDVTTQVTTGSQDAIELLGKDAGDIAIADINALIRFRDHPGAPDLKAVFIVLNRTPYALIARKSRGVAVIGDMVGKTLGVADGDLAIRLWPAVARQNGVDLRQVKAEKIGAAVRGPMLSAGQVDATTGLSFGTAIDLRDRGVPADDLMVFRFADFGCDGYGQAVIVNAKFAAQHPGTVSAFIRGLIGGIKFAAREPGKAIEQVLSQMDGGTRDIELERLKVVMRDNILTEDVRRNGLGGMTADRFDRSVQQIADDYKFRKIPAMADVFDGSHLPPAAARKIN